MDDRIQWHELPIKGWLPIQERKTWTMRARTARGALECATTFVTNLSKRQLVPTSITVGPDGDQFLTTVQYYE
jgi:hypothetical protein